MGGKENDREGNLKEEVGNQRTGVAMLGAQTNNHSQLKAISGCFDWSRPSDLNRRPTDYESVALPAELGWQFVFKDCVIITKSYRIQ